MGPYTPELLTDFVPIHNSESIRIDLLYTTPNNFTGLPLYPLGFPCLLHKVAFSKFQKAILYLEKYYPSLKFVIFDAFRPRSIQRVMFNVVVNTPNEIYVANPEKGSMHNYGMALDITLETKLGQELDMGTVFDAFTPLAQPQLEEDHLKQGLLTNQHIKNRNILRYAMVDIGGFIQLPHEWWHYNAFDIDVVKGQYPIIE